MGTWLGHSACSAWASQLCSGSRGTRELLLGGWVFGFYKFLSIRRSFIVVKKIKPFPMFFCSVSSMGCNRQLLCLGEVCLLWVAECMD